MQNRATVSLLQNESIHLNDHQLLGFLYKDTYTPDFLAKFYLSRANVLVSDLVMSVLKSFPNEEIKKIVSEKESMQEEKKLKL
jgi:hypothetical protein